MIWIAPEVACEYHKRKGPESRPLLCQDELAFIAPELVFEYDIMKTKGRNPDPHVRNLHLSCFSHMVIIHVRGWNPLVEPQFTWN